MNDRDDTKIDAYAHIIPLKYMEAFNKTATEKCAKKIPPSLPLYDLEHRFRIMDKFEGLVQVLTLAEPAIEEVTDPGKAAELAKLANDEMAEIVFKYPEKFVAFVACLPMNNMDAALNEADRAVNELRCRGVLVYSNINGKALDSPEFLPLFEKMSAFDLPVYIHPQRSSGFSDYFTEKDSKYNIYSVFGWPYETTVAMTRLVFGGVLEKYPKLKIITHHCGGMIPYYEQRIIQHHDKYEMGNRRYPYKKGLTKAPIDYYKMFYADTAIHGNTPALMCAYAFWGSEHLLFGADMPLGDRQLGYGSYKKTIRAIDNMDISEMEKENIFRNNAKRLMHLPI